MAAGEEDQKGICPRNGLACDEVKKITTLWPELEKWTDSMENDVSDLSKTVKEILEFQSGTKVYVVEIKQQITALETRLFVFMADLVKNLTANQQTEETRASKERKNTTDSWLNFAKWIIGGTIFLVVAYVFGGKQ